MQWRAAARNEEARAVGGLAVGTSSPIAWSASSSEGQAVKPLAMCIPACGRRRAVVVELRGNVAQAPGTRIEPAYSGSGAPTKMNLRQRLIFPPVNHCIYCGATGSKKRPLGKEHILPQSLGGTWILPRASCTLCGSITSRDEGLVARKTFGTSRRAHDLHFTEAGSPLPKVTYFVRVPGKQDERRTVSASADLFWSFGLELPAPGILADRAPSDVSPAGSTVIAQNHGLDAFIDTVLHDLPVGSEVIVHGPMVHWGPFNRVLAKIAHGYAFATFAGRGYRPLLCDLIRHRSDWLSHYVGGIPTPAAADAFHFLSHRIVPPPGAGHPAYLVVDITYFAGSGLPSYQVVAGAIDDVAAFENAPKPRGPQPQKID
jgi:hypothetical protein